MAKDIGNGTALKIILPVVVILLGGGVAAAWKLYDNVQQDIRILNEKMGQVANLGNLTNATVTRVDTNVQNLTDWARKTDKNQDRIMVRLGIASDLGEQSPPDSAAYTMTGSR